MAATLEEILAQGLQDLAQTTNLNDLEQVRVTYLGKKGAFTLHPHEQRAGYVLSMSL